MGILQPFGATMFFLKKMIPGRAKAYVHNLAREKIWQYRQSTWRSRVLPDFIIIGAQKSGTTSLYAHLSQHPQLWPSIVKEVHYFDGGRDPTLNNFEMGEAWYRAHFPFKKLVGKHQEVFEASPLYIFNPWAPRRIFELVPKVKIIAMLRNPTERSISHYFHERRMNRETLSLCEALQKEDTRLQNVLKKKNYKHHNFVYKAYKARGVYKEQLERYLSYFPRQQIMVLKSEDFFNDPSNTIKQVFEFVGVDPRFKINDLEPRNVAMNRNDVDPEIYEYLNNYFKPHNQELYELLKENYKCLCCQTFSF